MLLVDAGQRGELQHSQGLPTQLAHGGSWLPAGDEVPGRAGPAGHAVGRGGDAEGAGLGDRLAEEVNQSIADARVLDAGGREKQLHRGLPWVRWSPARRV